MHPEASQQRTRMVRGSVPVSSIRVTTSPSQNGSTVNDEITGSHESLSESLQNDQHKQGLVQRCSGSVATFALLRSTWNA
jgi:hypothetical protein